MHNHATAAAAGSPTHRDQIALATALVLRLSTLLVVSTPFLLVAGGIEWKQSRKRKRLLALALIAQLATIAWSGCGMNCTARRTAPGIHAPNAAGRSRNPPGPPTARTPAARYARLERDAQANDPRIAERAERRLRAIRLQRARRRRTRAGRGAVLMAALAPTGTPNGARGWNQPRPPLRKNGEIVVADGYGIQVHVEPRPARRPRRRRPRPARTPLRPRHLQARAARRARRLRLAHTRSTALAGRRRRRTRLYRPRRPAALHQRTNPVGGEATPRTSTRTAQPERARRSPSNC